MVSSPSALIQIQGGNIEGIRAYCHAMEMGVDVDQPAGLRMLVAKKEFSGALSPIRFILSDGIQEIIGIPMWELGDMTDKAATIRKAKTAVRTNSVIKLDRFTVHHRNEDVYIFMYKYTIVKRMVDAEAVAHWLY